MATLLELRELFADGTLQNRMDAAVCVAANTIRKELATVPNNVARLVWAKKALLDPRNETERILKLLLAESAALSKVNVQAVTDNQIQILVDASINFCAVG